MPQILRVTEEDDRPKLMRMQRHELRAMAITHGLVEGKDFRAGETRDRMAEILGEAQQRGVNIWGPPTHPLRVETPESAPDDVGALKLRLADLEAKLAQQPEPAKKGASYWTPERREEQARRARERNERKRAEKAAAAG